MRIRLTCAAACAVLAVPSSAGADTGSFAAPYARSSVAGDCIALFDECERGGAADSQTGALAARVMLLTSSSATIGFGAEFASLGVDHDLVSPAASVRYKARADVVSASAYASSIAGNTLNEVMAPAGALPRQAFAQLSLTAVHEQGDLLTGECAASSSRYVVDADGALAPTDMTNSSVELDVELTDCPAGRIRVDVQLGALARMTDHGVARVDVRDATLTGIDYSTS